MLKVGLLIGGGNPCLEKLITVLNCGGIMLTDESRSLILQEIEDTCK
jgi:hypothetical protein